MNIEKAFSRRFSQKNPTVPEVGADAGALSGRKTTILVHLKSHQKGELSVFCKSLENQRKSAFICGKLPFFG